MRDISNFGINFKLRACSEIYTLHEELLHLFLIYIGCTYVGALSSALACSCAGNALLSMCCDGAFCVSWQKNLCTRVY